MAKTFMGVRLRSLRAERGLTQAALAQALELSPSYLNQIEQDQRPLTVAVLLKIHRVLGVDIQQFSEDEEARLLAQLRDAVAAMPQPEGAVPLPELREVAAKLPQLAQMLLAMHQRHLADAERLEALSAHLGDGRAGPDADTSVHRDVAGNGAMAGLLAEPLRQMPFEAVRDFFFPTAITLMRLIVLPKRWLGRLQSKAVICMIGCSTGCRHDMGYWFCVLMSGPLRKRAAIGATMRSRAPCMWHRS
jgi:transcriptional regulator with XRE-family HTH domain